MITSRRITAFTYLNEGHCEHFEIAWQWKRFEGRSAYSCCIYVAMLHEPCTHKDGGEEK